MPIPGLGNWTSGYQSAPVNTDLAGQADDQILQLKKEIQLRSKYESDWGDSGLAAGYTDSGRHVPGSARAYYQSSSTVGTPTALRNFDNTAYQLGAAATLTAAKDQGRLWVNCAGEPGPVAGGYRLYVYDTADDFQQVSAAPQILANLVKASTDNTAISKAPVVPTNIVWAGGSPTYTTPATGPTMRAVIHATIHLKSGVNPGKIRLDLMQDTGGGAVSVQAQETNIGANDYLVMHIHHTVTMASGTVYTWDVSAECDMVGAVVYGYHAPVMVGNGASNTYHIFLLRVEQAS